ncbi:MAG: hypothetical protein RIT27_2304 [Pseudomonadota bacterium]|jgi:predicted nucleotidyltransferase
MKSHRPLIHLIKYHYPEVQAIYLFGSYINGGFSSDSDVDIALLLPFEKKEQLLMSPLHFVLENYFNRDVDLVNLRAVSTVFQNIIINTGMVVYCADEYSKGIFEMLVWSFYQKLNEERAEILNEFFKTGKAYAI